MRYLEKGGGLWPSTKKKGNSHKACVKVQGHAHPINPHETSYKQHGHNMVTNLCSCMLIWPLFHSLRTHANESGSS